MKISKLIFAIGLSLALCACDNSSKDKITSVSSGTYILNNGNWGSNDSNIGVYNPSTRKFTADAFKMANGVNLGDLGQDITGLGEEIYIAVNGSQTIFVTDADLKVKQQIKADKEGTRLSPRYFATCGTKVYVTYYEGYVGEIGSD